MMTADQVTSKIQEIKALISSIDDRRANADATKAALGAELRLISGGSGIPGLGRALACEILARGKLKRRIAEGDARAVFPSSLLLSWDNPGWAAESKAGWKNYRTDFTTKIGMPGAHCKKISAS